MKFINQLLEKDADFRLVSRKYDFEDIKNHPFFEYLNWNDLLNKRITLEWIQKIENKEDEIKFDTKFTGNDCVVTFIDPDLIEKEAQDEFVGFTCFNEKKWKFINLFIFSMSNLFIYKYSLL